MPDWFAEEGFPDGSDSSFFESAGSDIYPADGYAEGYVEDTMHFFFMDFTVNSAYSTQYYYGYTPPAGRKLLIVEMTVANTFGQNLPMYDTDFQCQWSASDYTGEFAYPITSDENGNSLPGAPLSEDQFPPEYMLAPGESRTGILVFEVPDEEQNFSVSHLEMFGDDSLGDAFFVYFTA